MKNFFLYDPKLLLYGFLIIFFASYGQTFFISLFNIEIRNQYNLTDGQFGLVYAIATTLSSLLLVVFAKLIDHMVESKSFCDEMLQQQQKFVNTISDPQKCADWWDSLFEKMIINHKNIRKNSSEYKIKFRMIHFLISNRLYLSKIKKFLFRTNSYTGQTLYDNN